MKQPYSPKPPALRRSQERGSALLIVFVFAAIIAIMLYRELPISAFEARRAKEQTLIDRGHEYQRAVQLYYRKFQGRYPANIDMLENTNSLRFLRRRYTDPFTGKDDWRLLHAGPGGQLMDSKVPNSGINGIFGQTGNNISGNSNSTPLGQGFSNGNARNGFAGDSSASSSSAGAASGFGSNAIGSNAFGTNGASSSSSDSDVIIPPVPRHAPVVNASAGGPEGGSTPSSSELDQDPSTPLLPVQDASAPSPRAEGGQATAAVSPNATDGTTSAAGQATGPNSMQMVQNMFASGANQPTPQTTAAGALNGGTGPGGAGVSNIGSTGNMSSGSFAGVASKAKGQSIKKVNDQTDYSLWEFWYDPTKDKSMGVGVPGSGQNGSGGVNVQPGVQLGQPANGAFGSSSASQSNPSPQAQPTTTDSGTGTSNAPPPPPAPTPQP